ncbi:MAG: HAD hydrolase-like protein [Deltaproteobacteria bacterium]|nr:HAD hydrolase-like protein [Deltaproteobacteria bacterium]
MAFQPVSELDLIKVIVFDCDGVMFDSKHANETFYNHILVHFSRPPMTSEEIEFVHQNTGIESVAHIFRSYPEKNAALEFLKTFSFEPFLPLMKVEPGLIDFLKFLRPTYHTAIATNRSYTMPGLLRAAGMTEYFDLVITCLDVSRPKPYPDELIRILEYFDVAANQMLYFGDSKVDELTANQVGVPLIAYKNDKLDAFMHVSDFDRVKQFLSGERSKKYRVMASG